MNSSNKQSNQGLVKLFLGVGLAFATLLVYCRTFDHPFVNFDDQDYVFNNPNLQLGMSAAGIRWAFTTFNCANWHPLTWLSLLVDYQLNGFDARGYHVTNVLFHVINTLLLFLVFDWITGMMWRSALVAALFALHPLHVESVAWVAERKDVLSTMFWLLTMLAYVYYVRQPSLVRYLLVALSLTLGLMAKPMLVTLPFVLLLLDCWPLRRWAPRGEPVEQDAAARPAAHASSAVGPPAWPVRPVSLSWLCLEKAPLFVLVLISCVVTSMAQRVAIATFEMFAPHIRVSNALLAYVGYLAKTFWPVDLAVYYPHPGADIAAVRVAGAFAMLVLTTVLAVTFRRGRPYFLVGWLWYLGTLVPVIGLVQIGAQAMADRYTYIPTIGIFLIVAWGIGDLMAAFCVPRLVPAAIAAGFLGVCVVLTWNQVGYWSGDLELWRHALAVTQKNSLAHNNFGTAYYRYGMMPQAKRQFEQAIDVDPKNTQAHHNLGNVYWDIGEYEAAGESFRRAIELDPNAAKSHYNLANVLAQLGQQQEAEAEYRRSIELDDTWSHAHHYLGLLLQSQGRLTEALEEFRRSVQLGNNNTVPLCALCERYLEMRQRLPAVLRGEERLSPDESLGFAWFCQEPFEKRYVQAVRLFAAAFNAMPALADAKQPRYRFAAARAAVRAACGQGVDADKLDEPEKAKLRGQALAWLQAELPALEKELKSARHPQQFAERVQLLRLWLQDEALNALRNPQALDKLPAAEREAWQKLWREHESVLTAATRIMR